VDLAAAADFMAPEEELAGAGPTSFSSILGPLTEESRQVSTPSISK